MEMQKMVVKNEKINTENTQYLKDKEALQAEIETLKAQLKIPSIPASSQNIQSPSIQNDLHNEQMRQLMDSFQGQLEQKHKQIVELQNENFGIKQK
jgi:hypothetical protein